MCLDFIKHDEQGRSQYREIVFGSRVDYGIFKDGYLAPSSPSSVSVSASEGVLNIPSPPNSFWRGKV